MNITVLPAEQLTSDHWGAWCRMQRAQPRLVNPFFRPEFTQAVAQARGGVEVAVWEKAGEPVAFLPFERTSRHAGRPVGSYLNQMQGLITADGGQCLPQDAVRAAGLRVLHFDHVQAEQTAFAPYQYVSTQSAYLDLSQGFDHYRQARGKSAAKFISHIFQKERKASREFGEVRVDVNSADRPALEQLLAWKTDQCHRTGVPCAFDIDWVVRLIDRLLASSHELLTGMLFTLRVGDRMAGALMCVRSGSLLQGVILGYDRELSNAAPGFVLLMRVAQMADSLGITRIDLGSGGESYKDKLASGYDLVTEGAVSGQPLLAPFYRGWFRTKDRLRATPLRAPVRRLRAWMLATRVRMGYGD